MKFEIPQDKFKSVIFKFIDSNFDSYKRTFSKHYPKSFFYLEGKRIKAEVIIPHNVLVLDWNLWNEIDVLFSFKHTKDIQRIVGEWADDRFGMENTLVDFEDFENEEI